MQAFIKTQTLQRAIRSLQNLGGLLMVVSILATPAVVSAASSPVGNLDGAVSGEMIQGWACDPDNFNQALTIHLYDGPAENHNPITLNLVADQTREAAIGSFCGGTTNHAFYFTIPTNLKDGKVHQIYGYAINIGTDAPNTHLGGSPISIQYGPGAAALGIEQMVDKTSVNPGQTLNYTVVVKNTGVSTAPGVQIIQNIPANMTLVGGGCEQKGSQVFCPLYDYAPKDIHSFSIKYKVADGTQCASNPVVDMITTLWGVKGSLGGPLAWSNRNQTTVTCAATPVVTTPVVPVVTPIVSVIGTTGSAPVTVPTVVGNDNNVSTNVASAVGNHNQVANGNITNTIGSNNVTKGNTTVIVRGGEQKVKVAAAVIKKAPAKAVSVPVTAKTGGEFFSLISILLGGSGLAFTRRFLA